MSTKKTNLKKKAATGAVLVALSGFVPQPFMQQAVAETAVINATGTFDDGITMTAGVNLNFKTLVATATGGALTVLPGGGTVAVKGFFVAVPVPGTIQFNALASKDVDVKITTGHTTAFVLTGAGAVGVITIDDIKVGGPIKTTTFPTLGVAVTGIGMINKTATINVGAQVSWPALGAIPVGKFSKAIKLSFIF